MQMEKQASFHAIKSIIEKTCGNDHQRVSSQ
jgi:hypothetical protein